MRLLRHRLPLAVVAAIAVAHSLPALGPGLQLDDHVKHVALANPAPVAGWLEGPADGSAPLQFLKELTEGSTLR